VAIRIVYYLNNNLEFGNGMKSISKFVLFVILFTWPVFALNSQNRAEESFSWEELNTIKVIAQAVVENNHLFIAQGDRNKIRLCNGMGKVLKERIAENFGAEKAHRAYNLSLEKAKEIFMQRHAQIFSERPKSEISIQSFRAPSTEGREVPAAFGLLPVYFYPPWCPDPVYAQLLANFLESEEQNKQLQKWVEELPDELFHDVE
jgi:hypothetical protein